MVRNYVSFGLIVTGLFLFTLWAQPRDTVRAVLRDAYAPPRSPSEVSFDHLDDTLDLSNAEIPVWEGDDAVPSEIIFSDHNGLLEGRSTAGYIQIGHTCESCGETYIAKPNKVTHICKEDLINGHVILLDTTAGGLIRHDGPMIEASK